MEQKLKDAESKKHKAEKMENYSRIVKEMHWPEVSAKKKEEIERVKNLLDGRNKRRSAVSKNRSLNQSESDIESHGRGAGRKVDWNFHNPLVPKPKLKRQPVVVDYLQEIRNKRGEQDSSSKHDTGANWKMINDQDIDDKTKIELLKARTKLIEENAERKEKMNKAMGASVEDNMDVNDMLIDAIEMKLSILDQID